MTRIFGTHRPSEENVTQQSPFTGSGMDVSPALRDCLQLGVNPTWMDNTSDFAHAITWQFVDASQVPSGPWLPSSGYWGP